MVVRHRDGRWGAVEVKLGQAQVEEAARHLIQLQQRIDEEKMGKASFLMVLTGERFAYRRDDGVLVVPIGCLKP